MKLCKPSKSELEQLYLLEKKSAREIGYFFGCCDVTILNWLREYSITTRQPGATKKSQYEKTKSPRVFNKHPQKERLPKAKFKTTYGILKDHSEDLKRLSTKFLQELIGVKCE